MAWEAIRRAMHRLDVEETIESLRGRWVVIRYDQSFASRPVRPLLRLVRRRGAPIETVLPAAFLGRARWLGLMPPDLVRLELLVGLEDPSRIRLPPIERLSVWQVRRRLLAKDPMAVLGDVVPCLNRSPRVRTNMMRSHLMQEPPDALARFAQSRTRPLEPEGFDRPIAAGEAPPIHLVLPCGRESARLLSVSLASLIAQADPSWRATIVPDGTEAAALARQACTDPRLRVADPSEPAAQAGWSVDRDEAGWTGRLRPGDRLAPFAILACRAEIAARPGLALLYTDSVRLDAVGEPAEPELLPGWSPDYLRERAYVSGLCLLAPHLARTAMAGLDIHAPGFGQDALLRAAETLRLAEVSHLPRLALLRGPAAPAADRGTVAAAESPSQRGVSFPPHAEVLARGEPRSTQHRCASFEAPLRGAPQDEEGGGSGRHFGPAPKDDPTRTSVSIVMPTRDRLDLLRPAVESLLNRTAPTDLELIVADNGSSDPAALAYLAAIDGTRRTRVIRVGGAFNFSRIVNAGVAAGTGEVILFLNNDIEIVSPDWLAEMLACFDRPDVGAVGAKLLYPDGTVQHAGTVVGWGGYAGHFGRRMAADTPAHLGRQLVRHEVSAVTAACLAVRRSHFDTVGGFDESFAVAFNDVDFCLRLREQGLRNLVAPQAVLIHHESASRGEDRGGRRSRFREERARFGDRWRALIQDDPYFHVALSLNRNCEMLE